MAVPVITFFDDSFPREKRDLFHGKPEASHKLHDSTMKLCRIRF